MSIFGDPQSFLKQASNKNNTLGRDMSNNSTHDLSSATPSADKINAQPSDTQNSKISDGMNKDMSTGPNTIKDKVGVNSASKTPDVSSKQTFQQLNKKGDKVSTYDVDVKNPDQGGMSGWIKKKVMGGTDENPTPSKEPGAMDKPGNPNSPMPFAREPDAQTPPSDKSRMPKPPEPPPHQSNIPKSGRQMVNKLPQNNVPKVPKQAKMPNLSIPKLPSFRR